MHDTRLAQGKRPNVQAEGAGRHGRFTNAGVAEAGSDARASRDSGTPGSLGGVLRRSRRTARPGQRFLMISRMRRAVSLGVLPTRTPTFSRASFFAWAVPEEPETIAPAWPMVLPSGAVNPAT